jgi:hypothetical protein
MMCAKRRDTVRAASTAGSMSVLMRACVCVCLELVPSHALHPREGHGAVRTCGG